MSRVPVGGVDFACGCGRCGERRESGRGGVDCEARACLKTNEEVSKARDELSGMSEDDDCSHLRARDAERVLALVVNVQVRLCAWVRGDRV